MAWLQNLAGRAEDLLNKIDKNAATVLNESNTKAQDNEAQLLLPSISSSFHEEFVDNNIIQERSGSGILRLSKSQTSLSSSLEIESVKSVAIEVCDASPKAMSEKHPPVPDVTNRDNIFERPYKSDSPSSKSSSLQDSFIMYDESQSNSEKISKLELENHELNKQLLNLQHLYSELRNENTNLHSQIETANYLAVTAQSEMEQYRARAQRILQEKEELIAVKKQSNSVEDVDTTILCNYNEELKKELEFQQIKNKELTEKVKKLSQDTAYLQQQIILIQNTTQQSSQSLEQALTTEKKVRLIAEEECRVKTEELQSKLQELAQQYSVVKIKDEEINSLREALKQRPSSNASDDFNSRIKSLTDTLMVKQHALETVTTERNALRIQLEKLENEYHNNLAQLQRAQVRVINVNDTDDVKSQVPQFMRVSPLDAGVTRRVKHAYSTVDAISIRTGIFLRRYPVARVFVFCYMVLLHLWAFIIIFLYAPSSR